MSLKQISFSPELLDAPEVKSVSMTDSGTSEQCDMTSKTDLSQIDFVGLPLNTQVGGFHTFNEIPTQSMSEPIPEEPMSEPIPEESMSDGMELKEVNFDSPESQAPQSGGFKKLDVNNESSDIDEDPMLIDTIKDETLSSKMKELRSFDTETKTKEQDENDKGLENAKIPDMDDYDLSELNNELTKEMNLYWDKELDEAYVENKVKQYINNYYSDEYKTYRSMFMYILSKTKIGYKVTLNQKGEYVLYKGNMDVYDIKLTPPKTVDINIGIRNMNKEMKELEFELYEMKTQLIDNADRIMDEDIQEFNKLQKKYYNIKHNKAIYQQYYKKINKQDDNEVDMFLNFMRKKTNQKNELIHVIETKYVSAPESFQENIRQSKISSLQLYNQIIDTFQTNSQTKQKMDKKQKQELHTLIKKYLTTGDAHTIIQSIEQFHKELKKRVNIVIEKKPIIDIKKHNKSKGKKDRKDKKQKD